MAAGKTQEKGSRTQAQERLLVQAAQKDPSQFAELYEQNFARIYAFVVRRVSRREVAEDLTSEVFEKALAALPRFDWRGIPFSAWLIRIAANVVTDQWKRGGREVTGDLPEPSVDANLDQIEDQARLYRLVEQLPKDQGRVIEMRFAQGKSIREIAGELGRSEGAVKQLQFRGLEALRTQLGGKHA
jgi:RNA polymerase sigma-70 factor (ECF subfamily)